MRTEFERYCLKLTRNVLYSWYLALFQRPVDEQQQITEQQEQEMQLQMEQVIKVIYSV